MTTYYFKGNEDGHPIEINITANTDEEAETQLILLCAEFNVECPMYLDGYAENGVYNACQPDEPWYGEEFEEKEEAEEPLTEEELEEILGDMLRDERRERELGWYY